MRLEIGKSYITKNRAWKVTPTVAVSRDEYGGIIFRCQIEVLIPGFEEPIAHCGECFMVLDEAEEIGGYTYRPDGKFDRHSLDSEMDWDVDAEYIESECFDPIKTIETNWDSFLFAEEK